jgi:AAA family ATP:ADP antiporter
MVKDSQKHSFSKWRAFFWPVHSYELKKLIPMLIIFFFLSFDYNVLRCIKDTLVITAKDSGPEVIPYIKVWVMFPVSVLFTWIFIRLSNRISGEKVFYTILGGFLAFFFLFAFVFYPYRELFYLHSLADYLTTILPVGCKGLITMMRYWSFTLFYVMAELWGTIIMTLLFWGFANQVTKLEEAKRFYGLFGVGINISGIAAGCYSIYITNLLARSTKRVLDTWGQTFLWLNCSVIIAGLIAIAAFVYLNKVLKKHPELTVDSKPKKNTKKLSMRENIRYLLSSRYILSLVAIVVSYNLIINLVEILWKHEVKALHPESAAYNLFMNKITIWIGILATLASFFISGNFLRAYGWTKTALITPLILLFTSIAFFGAFFSKSNPNFALYLAGISPLSLSVFFGTAQNCLSRASKYTVFDETKEIVFIPLSHEEKIKGKAAVDGICNRLGKSGGSVIYQFLFLFFSTISASAPYVAIILFSIVGIWILATLNLGKQFNEKIREEPTTLSLREDSTAVLST